MKKIMKPIIVTAILTCSLPAAAELGFNPISKSAPGKVEGAASFIMSSADYESPGGDVDVDNTILAFSAAYGLNETLDIAALVGLVTDFEAQGASGDGDYLGVAVRGKIPSQSLKNLHAYAQYVMVDIEGLDEDMLTVGITNTYQVDQFTTYAGLELLLSDSGDLERSDSITLRLGGDYDLGNNLKFNAGLAVLAETGLSIGISKAF